MSAYGVAHMRQVTMGPEIVEYLQRIDATLEPFGGRFIVHGGEFELLEGAWQGNLIVIEFPDSERANTVKHHSGQPTDLVPLDRGRARCLRILDGMRPEWKR